MPDSPPPLAAAAPAVTALAPIAPRIRVRVFVDFWNFTLEVRHKAQDGFKIDWSKIGPLFASESAKLIDPSVLSTFEGMHVYGSFDPSKKQDIGLRNWFSNTLDKFPGVHAVLLARQKKRSYPKCPACQGEVPNCPACNGDMRGTEEKGVDTRMVADMISLAWANAYDAAVLVSADRDFVPVADFLQTKGIKVVHGAFPPGGSQLSQRCWGSINLIKLLPAYKR